MFELIFLLIGEERLRGQHHECPGDDRHDHGGKEFLSNAIDRATVVLFNLKRHFFIPVIAFCFPSLEIERDDLFSGKGEGAQQIGEQHGHRAIGTLQQDDVQFDGFEAFALSGTELRQGVVGVDLSLLLPA